MTTNKDDSKEHMSRNEAARYLTLKGCPISATLLAKMACLETKTKGPPYAKTSWGRVSYLRSELDTWARANIRRVE